LKCISTNFSIIVHIILF